MNRRELLRLLGATTLTSGLGVSRTAAAVQTLKIGTLMPKSSPWGMVLSTWGKAVSDKTGGQLVLEFYFGGQQGDEGSMVGKIKTGQLHGAFLTGVGLGKIYKPILALQMPGLFSSWSKIDAARDAMKSEFEKGAVSAGFALTGWGDVGLVHRMSKGFAVQVPTDVKGKKPYIWRDDPMQSVLYQTLGGVTSVSLNVPEVLPNLNTGAINIVEAPSLFAEQLQWTGKLDTISSQAIGVSIGATVFSSSRLSALPADLKTILLDTNKIAAAALLSRIRLEDSNAFGRIKGKMTPISLSADEVAQWAALYKSARQRLAQGTFSPDLVTRLEGMAG